MNSNPIIKRVGFERVFRSGGIRRSIKFHFSKCACFKEKRKQNDEIIALPIKNLKTCKINMPPVDFYLL